MQTPIPAQIERWINIANNKKTPYDLRQSAKLHLVNIRDIINRSLNDGERKRTKNENMSIR